MRLILLIVLVQNCTFEEKEKEKIYLSILFSGFVYLFFIFFLSEKQIYTDRSMISFGNFGSMDPNEWCCYMIAPSAIALSILFDQKKKIIWKLVCAAFLFFSIYGCVLSGSRGGLLSIVLTLFFEVFYFIKKKPIFIFGIMFFTIGMIFIVSKYVLPTLSNNLISRFSFDEMVSSGGSNRIFIWKDILDFLLNNPLRFIFGVGFFGAADVTYVAHNQLIQVLLDNGIVGLILYLMILFNLFIEAKKKSMIMINYILY